ncbi:DUF2061 domain-containing protein [Robiginitalea sp. IMCC44478]|uniref:DUF2061 domain-containing protein n=1 Tax=Robiginitalea sp. IMCC44478 TaxID=3459122 RepID=UPI0040430A92
MIADQLLFNRSNKTANQYKADRKSDHPWRSIAKTLSWRVVGTLDTIVISWIITGTLSVAFSIGLVELITKMMLYFFHERVWNAISWGKH